MGSARRNAARGILRSLYARVYIIYVCGVHGVTKVVLPFNAQKYILSRKAQRPRGIFCEVLAPAAFTRRRRDSGGEPRGM